MASGPTRSASTIGRPSRGTAATMRQPPVREASTASSAATPATIGKRSALPIDPRSAFHPKGLAEAPAAMMPVAPAASATRTIAPTLPGSCTSTATTINGTPRPKSCAVPTAGRSASATIALGDRTGLIASMTLAETSVTSTPCSPSAEMSACRSPVSIDADVTAAICTVMPALTASPTRCAPSRSMTPSAAPRAASRKRATSGFWRLVIATPEG